jgi:DHA1 family tetracycline resistance protein-like MFS transporter
LFLAATAVQTNWSYYTIHKFNWNNDMVGYSLGVVGISVAIVQGGLIRVVIPKLGQKKSVFTGLMFYAAGLILFAFASQGWMMFAFTVIYCLGGFTTPAIQGIISSQIPSNQQGELQGALSSITSLTFIIGPALMNYLFKYFTSSKAPFQFPGMPYLAGAFLVLLSLVVSLFVLRNYKQPVKA